MKKRIVTSIVLLTLLMNILTACKNSNKSNKPTSQTPSESESSSESEPTSESETDRDDTDASDVIKYDDPGIIGNLPASRPDVSEDFFVHVNYDELKDAKLPEGYSSYSRFNDLADVAEAQTLDLLKSGNIPSEYSLVSDLYNMYMDVDARNASGFSSVMPYVEKIASVNSLEELYDRLYFIDNIHMISQLWSIFVSTDAKDSVNNVLYLYAPGLDLKDSDEYSKITDYGQMIKDADDIFFKRLLQKAGYDEKQAEEYIADRFNFEKKIAQHIYNLETTYREDYQEMTYNAYTDKELFELTGDFPLEKILNSMGLSNLNKIIIDQPEFFKSISNIISEDNLKEIKSYVIIDILVGASSYTDEEAFSYKNDWENAKFGSSGIMSTERQAYNLVSTFLPELVGQAYAEKYFSEKEKEDVEKIVYELLDVYRNRLENLDWMTDTTKNIAIEKLDAMGVYVGYPDELLYDYSDIVIDKNKDLFTNFISVIFSITNKSIAQNGKPVNRAAWGNMMAPNVVNACYNPTSNSIYFPAAILHDPFYNKDASLASNMGGIGIVIGHEVTHAFDTLGSQYDKNGNMSNWWTKEDREAFSKKTKAVAERYSRYELIDGYRVNGDLTIGETVADLGGAAAALQILESKEKEGENIDYKDFFEANAKIWMRIMTREVRIDKLKSDPHAPESLRTNINLSQFDKFYEVYDIKAGDAMYTAPENRLLVW